MSLSASDTRGINRFYCLDNFRIFLFSFSAKSLSESLCPTRGVFTFAFDLPLELKQARFLSLRGIQSCLVNLISKYK